MLALFAKSKPTAQEIIEAGRLLIAVEKECSRSQWAEWKRTNIGRSRRKIQFWQSVARFANRFDDDSRLHSLPQNFLYCLAGPELTKENVEEALEICRLVGQGALTERLIEDKVVKELEAQHYQVRRRVKYDEIGEIDVVVEGAAVIEVEFFLRRNTLFHAVGQALIYRQVHNLKLKAIVVGLPHPDCPAESSFFRAAQGLGVQIWLLRPPTFSIPESW